MCQMQCQRKVSPGINEQMDLHLSTLILKFAMEDHLNLHEGREGLLQFEKEAAVSKNDQGPIPKWQRMGLENKLN